PTGHLVSLRPCGLYHCAWYRPALKDRRPLLLARRLDGLDRPQDAFVRNRVGRAQLLGEQADAVLLQHPTRFDHVRVGGPARGELAVDLADRLAHLLDCGHVYLVAARVFRQLILSLLHTPQVTVHIVQTRQTGFGEETILDQVTELTLHVVEGRQHGQGRGAPDLLADLAPQHEYPGGLVQDLGEDIPQVGTDTFGE